jgi:pimeloyl-ACP methyl ester carboxylesterase
MSNRHGKALIVALLPLMALLAGVSQAAMTDAPASAPTLPRKGVLGVGSKALDEAAAKPLRLSAGEGLLVTLVVPGSSADHLGLQQGQVLLSVNGRKFSRHEELGAFTQTLRAGDRIEVEVQDAEGKRQTRQGLIQGRPLESSAFGEVRYGATAVDLGLLRTISHIPKHAPGTKLPTIFFLQGYTCDSQDFGANPEHSVRRLIDDWVRAGYAVHRFERPNIGDSRTSKDCRDIDYSEELALHQQVYRQLLREDYVDKANVFLFGHSLGSVTAPLLAEVHQPRGTMVYGVVARSWFEYFLDISRLQSVLAGSTQLEAESEVRALIPVYYEWLEKGRSPAQMKKSDPALAKSLEAQGGALNVNGDYVFGRSYKFWHSMNQRPMAQAWSRVGGKVLAMHAQFDLQAISPRDAELIAATVNESHPGQASFALVPGTEHAFLKADSYREAREQMAPDRALASLQQRYNPAIGQLTLAWLSKAKSP